MDSLNRINLLSCKHTDKEMAYIIDLCIGQQCPQLFLGDNNMADNALRKLNVYLMKQDRLVNLGIWKNNITENNIVELLPALHKVKKLFAQNNIVSNTGAALLGDVVGCNGTIHMLSIENNGITDDGLIDFCRRIQTNNTLTRLFLTQPNLSERAIHSAMTILAQSSYLDPLATIRLFFKKQRSPGITANIALKMNRIRKQRLAAQMLEIYITLYRHKLVHCEPVMETISCFLTPATISVY